MLTPVAAAALSYVGLTTAATGVATGHLGFASHRKTQY